MTGYIQIPTADPGCSHAFARHGGEHFDAKAAALATQRSRDFLRQHLD